MREQILHVGSLHELETATLDEWNILPRQFDLEIERMKAGAKQYGHVPQRHPLFAQLQYLLANKLRLCLFAAGLHQPRPWTDALAGEQTLLVAFGGALNDLVGKIQNRLGAAIVFLQLDDSRRGEVLGKIHDVAKVGAAKGIDALSVVAYHGNVVVGCRKQPDNLRLQVIGILIFIDHDEA